MDKLTVRQDSQELEQIQPKLGKNRRNFRASLIEWGKSFLQRNADPLRLWLAFRVALFILPVFAGFLIPFSEHNPLPLRYEPANIWFERLVRSWTRWDSGFYTHIANEGYAASYDSGDAHIAFFPLYPHLIRALSVIFTFNHVNRDVFNIAGIFISSVATLFLFVGLYRLARLDYEPEISRRTVLYLMVFPMSFFLLAVYTEALFMALAVWAFWAARTKHWWLAGLLAALGVLTKNQGVLLVAALGFEYLWQIRFNPRKLNWQILSFVLPVLAQAGWMYVNILTYGDGFHYVQSAQRIFARFFAWPTFTMKEATKKFFEERSPGATLPINYNPGYDLDSMLWDYPITLFFFGLGLVALYFVLRKRFQVSYLIFLILCCVQPLFSPNKISLLASMPRYLMIIFPAYILLALIARRWLWLHYLYLSLGFPLLGLFLARYVLNYWVA